MQLFVCSNELWLILQVECLAESLGLDAKLLLRISFLFHWFEILFVAPSPSVEWGSRSKVYFSVCLFSRCSKLFISYQTALSLLSYYKIILNIYLPLLSSEFLVTGQTPLILKLPLLMLKHISRHFSSPCFGKDKACCMLISTVHLETGKKKPSPFS